ncbi:MAG: hypothetical protein AMJ69_09855 [Gammaproteobacteria bacterium SG8_47]|nr:MAG: hypothetical protein AMJ69_09855 [Gammaproteobacteria bacterium SG8_47]
MTSLSSSQELPRLSLESVRMGRKARSRACRYFHVMGEGCFVETREGLKGPFRDKHAAREYLELRLRDRPEALESFHPWRPRKG